MVVVWKKEKKKYSPNRLLEGSEWFQIDSPWSFKKSFRAFRSKKQEVGRELFLSVYYYLVYTNSNVFFTLYVLWLKKPNKTYWKSKFLNSYNFFLLFLECCKNGKKFYSVQNMYLHEMDILNSTHILIMASVFMRKGLADSMY